MARNHQWCQPLMRPSAAALEPYDPAFMPVEINLSANENSFGLPREVRRALDAALAATPTNRYPDPLARALRAEIASAYGVPEDYVICGNGGDELIFNLFLAFGGFGHVMLHCPPDFSVYELYAGLTECECRRVWRDPQSFEIDWDRLNVAAKDATITVVTTPNNPTGTFVTDPSRCDHKQIELLAMNTDGIVLVDEAYIEFSREGRSCVDLIEALPGVVVLRTFSKAYALAGVRLGYMLADPAIIAALAAVRQPYSISVLDQAAARATWCNRAAFETVIEQIRQGRSWLSKQLSDMGSLGVEVWPSEANFLLVRLPHAHEVRCRLRDEHSVLVRDFSSAPGLKGCLRITVGTPAENIRLIAGLKDILGGE